MNEIVEPAERQQVVRAIQAPQPLSQISTCHVEVDRPVERGDDDERHAVGQRVLVDLKAERPEQEQSEDGRQDFGRQQPGRHRRRTTGHADRRGQRNDPIMNAEPGSITVGGTAMRAAGSRMGAHRSRRGAAAGRRQPVVSDPRGMERSRCDAARLSVSPRIGRWRCQLQNAAIAMPSDHRNEGRTDLDQQASRQDRRTDEEFPAHYPHHQPTKITTSIGDRTSAGARSTASSTRRCARSLCFKRADFLQLFPGDRQLPRIRGERERLERLLFGPVQHAQPVVQFART